MSNEANKTMARPLEATELVNRFFNEVVSSPYNVALLDELLYPDFRSHHFPAPPGSDKAGFIGGVNGLLAAFPDIQVTVHDQFG